MTVGELIERLKQFDSNGIVYLDNQSYDVLIEVHDAYRIVYTHEGIGDIDVCIVMKDEEESE
jgi:hypothetical protein